MEIFLSGYLAQLPGGFASMLTIESFTRWLNAMVEATLAGLQNKKYADFVTGFLNESGTIDSLSFLEKTLIPYIIELAPRGGFDLFFDSPPQTETNRGTKRSHSTEWSSMVQEEESTEEKKSFVDSKKILVAELPAAEKSCVEHLRPARDFFERRLEKLSASVKDMSISKILEIPHNWKALFGNNAAFISSIETLVAESQSELKLLPDQPPLDTKFTKFFDEKAKDSELKFAGGSAEAKQYHYTCLSAFEFISSAFALRRASNDYNTDLSLSAGAKAVRYLLALAALKLDTKKESRVKKNMKFCKYSDISVKKAEEQIKSLFPSSRVTGETLVTFVKWMIQAIASSFFKQKESNKIVYDGFRAVIATYFVNDRLVIERSYPKRSVEKKTKAFKKELIANPRKKPTKGDTHIVEVTQKIKIVRKGIILSTQETAMIRKANLSLQNISSTVSNEVISLDINVRRKYVNERMNDLNSRVKVINDWLLSRKDRAHKNIKAIRDADPDNDNYWDAKGRWLPFTTAEWDEQARLIRNIHSSGHELRQKLVDAGFSVDEGFMIKFDL